VLRDFENPALEGKPDPLADLEAFYTECLFADLGIVERRLDRARKEKTNPLEVATFEHMKVTLEHERPLRSLPEGELHRDQLKGYALLTDRPLMVVLNRREADAAKPLPGDLAKRLEQISAEGFVLSASVEAEIAGMDAADQPVFLEDLGLKEPGLVRFLRTAYHLMDLISFFTVGPDEVRAWTIKRGANARQAAGRIHSDLERGFIRAEVTPYPVFMEYGSEHAVKEAGRLKLEGKDYVVADGDILHVRFAV
jgi:ribosome-binding ATPase YchF (GTP1/OBG family)